MKFGWINGFGAIIIVLIMIPNIIYTIKNKGEKNLCDNKFMNIIEQIGRYTSIIFMWLPLLVWEFGFKNVSEMIIYFIGNIGLLIAYIIIFSLYLKKKTRRKAIALAIIPSCIFIMSGILLRHLLLLVSGVIFSIGHIYVTIKNNEENYESKTN